MTIEMGFNIPMGVGSALSGAAGAYNQYAVDERNFKQQKDLAQMAFDNYLEKLSQANEQQFEYEKKAFEWKKEQEKLYRKAQVAEKKYVWEQDDDIVDDETREYRKWTLDLLPIYGEKTNEVVNEYLRNKKIRKDFDAQSEYIDRVNTALQSASPEQLRDPVWQAETKRKARLGLKVRDLSLLDKVDGAYFPKIERESPTNIPNDLEAFTLQHPLAKGRTYSSLPADVRKSIYEEWDEKKVSMSNARMGDDFMIAAKELYPGIDPQHIQGEAITKVREHMAKNKGKDTAQTTSARESERFKQKSRDVVATFKTSDAMLDQIEDLADKVITAKKPTEIPSQYISGNIGSITKYNSDAAVYLNTVKAFGSMLTRAAGEKGVLTEQDVERVLNGLPKITDTVEIKEKKLKVLRKLYGAIKTGAVESYTANIDDVISGKSSKSKPNPADFD